MDARSPLEIRLSRHLAMTYAERDALRWLERRERSYPAGAVLIREGEPAGELLIVSSGWLHGSISPAPGVRQILRFYFRGDITATFSIAWGHSAATLTAVSNCTVFTVEREAFGRLFQDHPRLGALLYAVSASEEVAMADRLTSVGRTNGITRVATLLLDIRSRLLVTGEVDEATFELPLTQQELGDAVGLTKAHVNRTLKSLEETGLLERQGRLIRINDVKALAQMVEFKDRHRHVATEWLPPVRSQPAQVT